MLISESFKDYYLLCERHNNVSASVNQNVKQIIQSLADHIKKNFAVDLETLLVGSSCSLTKLDTMA